MIAALLAVLVAAAGAAPAPGFFAAPEAANVLGVEALDAAAGPAAMEILRQLAASRSLHGVAIDGDPAAGDCSGKPYAAAAQIATTIHRTGSGWYFDVGLMLVDCAGWSVDEWHDGAILPNPPAAADEERFGLDLLVRLRTWTFTEPVLAHQLFTQGVAYDPATAKPSYFYTLFKTDDGYMRVLVRPGGPAYVAGMRSDDIVDKLDGKYWWEYGTYQTQQRAYDGLPHTFELTRGKTTVRVALGAPFLP